MLYKDKLFSGKTRTMEIFLFQVSGLASLTLLCLGIERELSLLSPCAMFRFQGARSSGPRSGARACGSRRGAMSKAICALDVMGFKFQNSQFSILNSQFSIIPVLLRLLHCVRFRGQCYGGHRSGRNRYLLEYACR